MDKNKLPYLIGILVVVIVAALLILNAYYSSQPPAKITALGHNLILSSSADVVGISGSPQYWNKGANWGDCQAAYAVIDDAGAAPILKVTVSNCSSGDAKWWHDLVDVDGDSTYMVSDRYNSTARSRIAVWYQDVSGKDHYPEVVNNLPPSATMKKISATVKLPAGAKRATPLHILEEPGYLITTDYNLSRIS